MPTTMLETTICILQAYFHADVIHTNSVAVVKIPIDKDTTIASCSEEHVLLTWNPISSVVRIYMCMHWFWNPISSVVRIYVYMHGFWNPISSVVCIYVYMHGFLKIYLNMQTKMHGFPTQNVCFRPDLGAA